MASHRDAEDGAFRPLAEIRLDEGAHRIGTSGHPDEARGRAVAALEVIADHAGAAAHTALPGRSASGTLQRFDHMLGLHLETIDIVEIAVIGLGSDRKPPVLHVARCSAQPLTYGIAHDAAGIRIGDIDRRLQFARFLDPDRACHIAIALYRLKSV